MVVDEEPADKFQFAVLSSFRTAQKKNKKKKQLKLILDDIPQLLSSFMIVPTKMLLDGYAAFCSQLI